MILIIIKIILKPMVLHLLKAYTLDGVQYRVHWTLTG